MKDDTISRAAAIDAMMKLQAEDIEAYGASIPEGFDGDRAVTAIKALPPAQPDVPDTNVGKICEYYDLCRNGRDEKKLREELLSAQPEIVKTILEAGYMGQEVRFRIDGRLFAIRELAQ